MNHKIKNRRYIPVNDNELKKVSVEFYGCNDDYYALINNTLIKINMDSMEVESRKIDGDSFMAEFIEFAEVSSCE